MTIPVAALLGVNLPFYGLEIFSFILSIFFLSGSEISVHAIMFQELPPDEAGSVLSLSSLIENIAGFTGFIILGAILKENSVQDSWVFSGLALFVICGWLALRQRNTFLPKPTKN